MTETKNRCSADECGAEFENHVKAMWQIKADSVEQHKVGMKVKPSWEPIRVRYGEDVYGLKFEPVE